MRLEDLRHHADKVLNCDTQDSEGLNDFQKSGGAPEIPLDRVGIERFRIPLSLSQPDGSVMSHDAEASMAVSLKGGKTGVNMSRFCTILQEETKEVPLCRKMIERTLGRFRRELRDFDHEDPIEQSFLGFKLHYPLKQLSLESSNWGWQYYEVEYDASDTQGLVRVHLQVKYEYSSTCPCSLSLAKQYERDYRVGKTQKGHGIATAHAQRSVATVAVEIKEGETGQELTIEELVKLLRKALPTETQSLAKRIDEQSFAILNGEHPMFVEDAARRLSCVLDGDSRIGSWKAKVEHLEGLHSHNAVASIQSRKAARPILKNLS
ncbi:MAG: GTP cyclohydrolase FolE2 [Bacteriovoracales bacterium]|nr:GTP cyclohydrolase FolE2 [Bacteriovoracales bacterium]